MYIFELNGKCYVDESDNFLTAVMHALRYYRTDEINNIKTQSVNHKKFDWVDFAYKVALLKYSKKNPAVAGTDTLTAYFDVYGDIAHKVCDSIVDVLAKTHGKGVVYYALNKDTGIYLPKKRRYIRFYASPIDDEDVKRRVCPYNEEIRTNFNEIANWFLWVQSFFNIDVDLPYWNGTEDYNGEDEDDIMCTYQHGNNSGNGLLNPREE